SSDSEVEEYESSPLSKILEKLTLQEQVLITQNFKMVPALLNALWTDEHKRLDLGKMQWKLGRENVNMFLQRMRTHFLSAHFCSDRLQSELSILEIAQIKELPQVVSCDISGGRSQTVNSEDINQWPFHALPKLMQNLIQLEVYAPIMVCFIEHFKKLDTLTIHATISKTALEAILSSDIPLRELSFPGRGYYSLEGILQSKHIENLLLNFATFESSFDEIMELPNLLQIKLHGITDHEKSLRTLKTLIQKKAPKLAEIQINCHFMASKNWLGQLQLNQCCNLVELELINFKFEDQDISDLNLPVSQHLVALHNCEDIKNMQLLHLFKSCPKIDELVLGECPKLTGDVLLKIFKVRRSDTQAFPLVIKVSKRAEIWKSYEDNV
ncbi:hypothetical protein KR018_005934, partial [Drosophila ironensis]